jgi:hypothetical protein
MLLWLLMANVVIIAVFVDVVVAAGGPRRYQRDA